MGPYISICVIIDFNGTLCVFMGSYTVGLYASLWLRVGP